MNNEYTQSQISTMQQDAMRRVNEMQRVARERLGNRYVAPESPVKEQPIQHHEPSTDYQHIEIEDEECIAPEPQEEASSGFKGILDKLNLDKEKLIVIGLLVVLVNEGADIKLILALVYILL